MRRLYIYFVVYFEHIAARRITAHVDVSIAVGQPHALAERRQVMYPLFKAAVKILIANNEIVEDRVRPRLEGAKRTFDYFRVAGAIRVRSAFRGPRIFGVAAGEDCDDNNIISGDGCAGTSAARPCTNEGANPPLCGNGRIDRNYAPRGYAEDCDDGNTTNGDGCSNI